MPCFGGPAPHSQSCVLHLVLNLTTSEHRIVLDASFLLAYNKQEANRMAIILGDEGPRGRESNQVTWTERDATPLRH